VYDENKIGVITTPRRDVCADLQKRTVAMILGLLLIDLSLEQAALSLCDYQFVKCYTLCGSPTYFPWACLVDVNSVYNPVATQVIASCSTPVNCPACAYGGGVPGNCTVQTCAACTWQTLIVGALAWCQCCANNCDGYQAACISNGFCTSKCQALLECNPKNAPAIVANATTTTSKATSPLGPTPVPTASPIDALTTCAELNSQWFTVYAPGTFDDVRYSQILPLTTGTNASTCTPGTLQPVFHSDAVRRWNFYRSLLNLQPMTPSATSDVNAQQCALEMAINYNPASPQGESVWRSRFVFDRLVC
jgi:hypothetical protein